MDDARSRVSTASGVLRLPDSRLVLPQLTFFGNPTPFHAHLRISVHLYLTRNIFARDALTAPYSLQLLDPSEFFSHAVAFFSSLDTPFPMNTPCLAGTVDIAVPKLPASASPRSKTAPCAPGVVAAAVPDSLYGPSLLSSAAASARLGLWHSRFPRSLSWLRARHGRAGLCLPPLLDSRTLRCLLASLDAEDAIVAEYRSALSADARRLGVYTSGSAAVLRALDFPDGAFLAYLERAQPSCPSGPCGVSLAYGLLPFGTWAVSVALRLHFPSVAPETSEILDSLGANQPRVWDGLTSLQTLLLELQSPLLVLDTLASPYDRGLFLPPLLRLLDLSPGLPQHPALWESTLHRVHFLSADHAAGVLDASATLAGILLALEQLCVTCARALSGCAHVPANASAGWLGASPSSSVSSLSSSSSPPPVAHVLLVGPQPARSHHCALIRDAATLHRRFGIQSERVFRALASSSLGVARLQPRELSRFVSGASARSSAHRTAIRSAATPKNFPIAHAAGVAASLDLTRQFLPDVDGFVCAAVFMDRFTWHIWIGPMKNHSCSEFIRVFKEYQSFVRSEFRSTLRHVLADSDPCFTDNHGVP